MSSSITAESPDTADAVVLIDELEAQLEPFYPRASRHGLSVAQLLEQAVAFFLLRTNGEPAACGGVKLFGTEYGEIKRMYVRPQFRGRGFALLRLETGIHQREAIGLYERAGFTRIPPFGDYKEDPLSVFFEKRIGQ
jgi:putative acetyltransferase